MRAFITTTNNQCGLFALDPDMSLIDAVKYLRHEAEQLGGDLCTISLDLQGWPKSILVNVKGVK